MERQAEKKKCVCLFEQVGLAPNLSDHQAWAFSQIVNVHFRSLFNFRPCINCWDCYSGHIHLAIVATATWCPHAHVPVNQITCSPITYVTHDLYISVTITLLCPASGLTMSASLRNIPSDRWECRVTAWPSHWRWAWSSGPGAPCFRPFYTSQHKIWMPW